MDQVENWGKSTSFKDDSSININRIGFIRHSYERNFVFKEDKIYYSHI